VSVSRDGSDCGRENNDNDFDRTRNGQWVVNLSEKSISLRWEFVAIYFCIFFNFFSVGLAFFVCNI
jgi:hypothetical protein